MVLEKCYILFTLALKFISSFASTKEFQRYRWSEYRGCISKAWYEVL